MEVLQTSGGYFEMFLTSSPKCIGVTAEARHRIAVWHLVMKQKLILLIKKWWLSTISITVDVNDSNVKAHSD